RGQDVVGVALEVGQLVQPLAQLGVGVLQRGPLVTELGRHVVEGHRQPADLVVGDRIDAQVELAARDGVGALGHPLHRPREAAGIWPMRSGRLLSAMRRPSASRMSAYSTSCSAANRATYCSSAVKL